MTMIPSDGPDLATASMTEGQALTALRRELRQGLPALIRHAMAAYRRFSGGPPPHDAKSFLAYQAACRAAVAHIQLLIKLADFVHGEGADDDAGQELDRLLVAAREALGENDAEEF
jgi:hypothetical protein